MSEPTMPILDTRHVLESKPLKIIVDNGTPEGKEVVFHMKPMTSDIMFKFQTKQKQVESLRAKSPDSAKTNRETVNALADLLVPLMTPLDEFKAVIEPLKQAGVLAYENIILTLVDMAKFSIRVDQPETETDE